MGWGSPKHSFQRHHAGARRGGRCEHRRCCGESLDDALQPAVVRSEVVPPLRDAVCFVDDKQAESVQQGGEDVGSDLLTVEPFR